MAVNENHSFVFSEISSFIQFNKTMKVELQLTNKQFEKIQELNRQYWIARENVLNDPHKLAWKTALLACWDKWQIELSTYLTNLQLEKFMQWQSKVDLLSESLAETNSNL